MLQQALRAAAHRSCRSKQPRSAGKAVCDALAGMAPDARTGAAGHATAPARRRACLAALQRQRQRPALCCSVTRASRATATTCPQAKQKRFQPLPRLPRRSTPSMSTSTRTTVRAQSPSGCTQTARAAREGCLLQRRSQCRRQASGARPRWRPSRSPPAPATGLRSSAWAGRCATGIAPAVPAQPRRALKAGCAPFPAAGHPESTTLPARSPSI